MKIVTFRWYHVDFVYAVIFLWPTRSWEYSQHGRHSSLCLTDAFLDYQRSPQPTAQFVGRNSRKKQNNVHLSCCSNYLDSIQQQKRAALARCSFLLACVTRLCFIRLCVIRRNYQSCRRLLPYRRLPSLPDLRESDRNHRRSNRRRHLH